MKNYFLLGLLISSFNISAAEMIIGKENIHPGIDLVFEGAPKDMVHPKNYFRAESATDIHIEMLANWSENAPTGSPLGGFVAYLNVEAFIESESGKKTKVKLTPHLNISDNIHYAQNIKLPGKINELYKVTFKISPPRNGELGIHYDWNSDVGSYIDEAVFEYSDLNFEEIALSSRR